MRTRVYTGQALAKVSHQKVSTPSEATTLAPASERENQEMKDQETFFSSLNRMIARQSQVNLEPREKTMRERVCDVVDEQLARSGFIRTLRENARRECAAQQ